MQVKAVQHTFMASSALQIEENMRIPD